MNRPLLVRLVPDRIKQSLFYRYYNPLPERLAPLCASACLRFAPGTRMVGLLESDVIGASIAVTGFYELELSKRIRDLALLDGRMIDVGANIGYFTLLWLSARPTNTCHSFEASPRNIQYLRRNINVNGFDDRVIVHPEAAGRELAYMTFDAGSERQTGWGGFSREKSARSFEVPVVRIDSVITDAHRIDVLKIDVEGADTWVLLGCEKLLRAKQVRHIFFEQNTPRMTRLGIDRKEAGAFLESMNYHVTCLGGQDAETTEYHAMPR